jgi:hypothetical protein
MERERSVNGTHLTRPRGRGGGACVELFVEQGACVRVLRLDDEETSAVVVPPCASPCLIAHRRQTPRTRRGAGAEHRSMDTQVALALLGSAVSILIAAGTALWTRNENRVLSGLQQTSAERVKHLEDELQRQVREEQRRATELATLTPYREDLLEAASDLQHRLRNIREYQFLRYLHGSRHDTAVTTTLFRFARYIGVLEILYSEVNYLRFETADKTQHIAALIKQIGVAFASDRYDRVGAFQTSKFMIWREEQRAMGEAAIWRTTAGTPQVVGYSEFVERCTRKASQWFQRLVDDLEAGGMPQSKRLAVIEGLLAQLVQHLEAERKQVI